MTETTNRDNQQAEIADRIRKLIALRRTSQNSFARELGLDRANLSKHLSGRLPITAGLINRIVADMGVSKRWLMTGEGAPYEKPVHADYISAPYLSAQGLGNNTATTGTPIYDIDVVAGCRELSQMFTADRIIGYVSLPRLRTDNAIVRVSGDSMMPVITPGAYVAINPNTDLRNILWGQIYVIVMEDYRLVKYLRRHDDPTKLRLLSANPDYDEMIIDRADIRALYLVEAIINYDLRC